MKVVFGLIALAAFAALFGSPIGIVGSLPEAMPPAIKTKIVLALSIFGFLAITWLAWSSTFKSRTASGPNDLAVAAIALLIAVAFAYTFQDCLIFNFCDTPESSENCNTSYDRAGAFLDCD